MTDARYLIRIDDICEGLNIENFKKLVDILTTHNIRPIIAVVPNNKDENLIFPNSIYGEKFWNLIQKLQNDFHWKIGIHGHDHKYVNKESGILEINNFSEFAGLKYSDQQLKIANSIKVMKSYNLSSDLFIAPAHSFDKNTLKVLIENGIKSISDGFYTFPGKDKDGLFWIPQQLWDFKYKKKGIWTVNLHINNWQDADFKKFVENIKKFDAYIVDYEYVNKNYYNNKLNFLDFFRNKYEIKKSLLIYYLVKFKTLFKKIFI